MPRRFALLSLLALSATASATELSLQDALDASSGNRDLRIAAQQEDAARFGVDAARASYDPSLVGRTSTSSNDNQSFIAGLPVSSTTDSTNHSLELQGRSSVGTTWAVGAQLGQSKSSTLSSLGADPTTEVLRNNWTGLVDLSVTQDVLAPFRRSSEAIASREARERLDSASISRAQAEADATQAIANAWWSWSSAARVAESSERALDEARTLEDRTQAWLDEGKVARLELDRAKADRLAAQRDNIRTQAELRRTADALLVTMGQAPGTDITPAGDGSIASGDVDLDASLQRALADNLDIQAARLDSSAATEANRDALRSRLPELNATGSLGMATLADTSTQAVSQLTTDGMPRWSLGLDLTVPLGGRAARATAAQSATELQIATLRLEDAEARVRADVRAAVDAVETARLGVELAHLQLAVARATEDGEQARVDEGVTRLDDLISARNARLQAEADLISAESDRASAELTLLAVEGRLGGSLGV